jgi:hypothetical protein
MSTMPSPVLPDPGHADDDAVRRQVARADVVFVPVRSCRAASICPPRRKSAIRQKVTAAVRDAYSADHDPPSACSTRRPRVRAFDHDYYRQLPRCAPRARRNYGGEIDKGIDGPYEAAVHFFSTRWSRCRARWPPRAQGPDGRRRQLHDHHTVMQISEVVEGSS